MSYILFDIGHRPLHVIVLCNGLCFIFCDTYVVAIE